jgi:trehalose utilization protein
MNHQATRRRFLTASAAAVGGLAIAPAAGAASRAADTPTPAARPTRVVVWDEQQPEQREAYEHFLGNWIADYLRSRPGLAVRSVKLNDPGQGLVDDVLGGCDVLLWWGHRRQAEVAPEAGRKVVERIKAGALALVALHSAHWSTPFMEAMNERTRLDIARHYQGSRDQVEISYVAPPRRYTLPTEETRLTPYVIERKYPDGVLKAAVHLPYCCFPAYRTDGKPSQIRLLKPDHPIAADLPRVFELPHTEMYNEPFHVPEPDEVILEERWATGDWFRSGMVWQVGKGRVFYFRPGHETFAVYKERPVLRLLENAVRWLGSHPG